MKKLILCLALYLYACSPNYEEISSAIEGCTETFTYEVDAAMARTADGYSSRPTYNGYNWHMNSTQPLRYPFQMQIGDKILGWRLAWYNYGTATLTGQLQRASAYFYNNGVYYANIGPPAVLTTNGYYMEVSGLNEDVLSLSSYSLYVTSTGQSGNYAYNAEILISRNVQCL
jgi:hypothetical protein